MATYAKLIGGKNPKRGEYLDGVSIVLGAPAGSPVNGAISVPINDLRISYFGGDVGLWGLTYPRYFYNKTFNLTYADGTRDGSQGKVAFDTNATSFEMKIYSAGPLSSFTLFVDGKQVNAAMIATPNDGSQRYVTVDLAAAGLEPGYHSIVFEFYGGANFGGLSLPQGASVRALQDNGPRLVFLGDSFTEGNGAPNKSEDYASIVARSLGIEDSWQSAMGGTGWQTALNNRPALKDRIEQDGVAADGDIYVIAMGVNDSSVGLYDSVVSTLTKLTEGRPDAKVFVIGAWNTAGPAINPRAAINAEIKAAVGLFDNVVFLDPSGVTFTKSDATHPDAAGQWKLGEWAAEQIRQHLGVDGLIEQNVAGDVVGPLFLKDYDPDQTYQFAVLENGLPSDRFEILDSGNAFPVIKLKEGRLVSTLGNINVTVKISAAGQQDKNFDVTFSVRKSIFGNESNNYIVGDQAGTFVDGGGGDDYLIGKGGIDRLIGGAGNDKLDGGESGDYMAGGAGNDSYWVDSVADTVVEQPNEGYDIVNASLDGYVLPEGFEGLNLIGAAAKGGGNSGNNYLRGNALNNTMYGHAGDDRLDGFDGDDLLFGDQGNDVLVGGLGADTMTGGLGHDTYYVDNTGDVVTEGSGAGADTVYSSLASYTLAANVEYLRLIDAAISGTGNSLSNRLYGNSLDNILSGLGGNDEFYGGAGADRYVGGTGNDIYYVEDEGDTIVELAGEGTDRAIISKPGSFTLPDHVENLELRGASSIGVGNALNNYLYANTGVSTLRGESGNDWLYSSGGDDTLIGGIGNDVYVIDGQNVIISEAQNEGYDRVIVNFSNYIMPDNVEELNLSGLASGGTGNAGVNYMRGGAQSDTFYGLGGNDTLEGAAGNDALYGGEGNDYLNGGSGSDLMVGGSGHDSFVVDSLDDQVIELAGEGVDRVISNVEAITLADHVEFLTLGAGAVRGVGNAENNTIQGNSSANYLAGMDGADRLSGDAGDDELDGGNGSDYLDGGAGLDSAIYNSVFSDFSFSFVGSTLYVTKISTGERDTLLNMETLKFTDGTYSIDYTSGGLSSLT